MTTKLTRTDDSPDHRALAAALGELVIVFSELEFNLKHITGILIGSEEVVGHIVTASLSFRSLVDIYCALLRLRLPDQDAAHVDSIHRTLSSAEATRNQLIHSFWMPDSPHSLDDDDDEATGWIIGSHIRVKMSMRGKKGFRSDVEILDDEHVEKMISDVRKASALVHDSLPEVPPRVRSRRRPRSAKWAPQPGAHR